MCLLIHIVLMRILWMVYVVGAEEVVRGGYLKTSLYFKFYMIIIKINF